MAVKKPKLNHLIWRSLEQKQMCQANKKRSTGIKDPGAQIDAVFMVSNRTVRSCDKEQEIYSLTEDIHVSKRINLSQPMMKLKFTHRPLLPYAQT
jgi:hypothetical protein